MCIYICFNHSLFFPIYLLRAHTLNFIPNQNHALLCCTWNAAWHDTSINSTIKPEDFCISDLATNPLEFSEAYLLKYFCTTVWKLYIINTFLCIIPMLFHYHYHPNFPYILTSLLYSQTWLRSITVLPAVQSRNLKYSIEWMRKPKYSS